MISYSYLPTMKCESATLHVISLGVFTPPSLCLNILSYCMIKKVKITKNDQPHKSYKEFKKKLEQSKQGPL